MSSETNLNMFRKTLILKLSIGLLQTFLSDNTLTSKISLNIAHCELFKSGFKASELSPVVGMSVVSTNRQPVLTCLSRPKS